MPEKYLQWFDEYTKGFLDGSDIKKANLRLKIEHTHRVVRNAVQLSEKMGLDSRQRETAFLAALFHDLGRFEQFSRFGTFRDFETLDHGNLGVSILEETGVLGELPEERRQMVRTAVRWHNKLEIPPGLDPETDLQCRLVRDSDKLDIWHLTGRYYADPVRHSLEAIGEKLEDTYSFTAGIYGKFMAREEIDYTLLRTKGDFVILQLSWIEDINFPETFAVMAERKVLEPVANALPAVAEKDKIKKRIDGLQKKKQENGGKGNGGIQTEN